MKKRYVIGVDFGTLSGRALLLDAVSGEELAQASMDYPHGVMEAALPCGKKLPPDFALQHPEDYFLVLKTTVGKVLEQSRIPPESVAGLGVDFTTCTVLPVGFDGVPLCLKPEFAQNPHAFVKLWKHHGAQSQADRITALAKERGEAWLKSYGGRISSEWLFPKILETVEEAPEVFDATARFAEAGDFLTWQLTGTETHACSFAGFKGLWNAETGFPSNDFFKALHPRLDGIIGGKVSEKNVPAGALVGYLNETGSRLTGLPQGIAVSAAQMDAEAALPALGVFRPEDGLLILGTSGVQLLNSPTGVAVPGICGTVREAVYPGLYTYEAGQSGLGDVFDWFVKNCVPASYEKEAEGRGISIHQLLREKASALRVGENRLIALDWLNGNRSVLSDSQLSGMILGLTLQTKPEEIYRALLEATAFSTRMILETFAKGGIRAKTLTASGGIALKDPLMMQIYANVLQAEIKVANTTQAAARGSAIYASVVGGIYGDVFQAVEALKVESKMSYRPKEEEAKAYEALYEEYRALHDYFGKGGNDVMKRLKHTP